MPKIVMPGQEVGQEQKNALTYSDEKGVYATVISLQTEDGKIIPLEGPYQPAIDDYVIGKISEVKFGGYDVDLNSPYKAFLPVDKLNNLNNKTFSLGEVIIAKIVNVNEVRDIELGDPRPLEGGILVKVSPVKIPRIIGKKNSMVNMISFATNCKIYIGKNGLIFVSSSGDYLAAIKAIKMIEKQAHFSGLTQKVAEFLEKETNKKIPLDQIQQSSTPALPAKKESQNQKFEHGQKRGFQKGFNNFKKRHFRR
ncbi:MAG: exosome complex protein Rrp4 [Candidatus Micrarchaeota archaeon]|nr:exosome complex protein Rrp4 [Candidatus Micrarchaeota archaeon]